MQKKLLTKIYNYDIIIMRVKNVYTFLHGGYDRWHPIFFDLLDKITDLLYYIKS